MEVNLQHVGKRFNKDWTFRGLDYQFKKGYSYAILGPNGSGKSTLLKILLSSMSPSEGKLIYSYQGHAISDEQIFQYTGFSAPYLELIEEFSLLEIIKFHFQAKKLMPSLDNKSLIHLLGFENYQSRPLKYFSSGMKQRTKLALAICSDTPLLMLDEPTSNLDKQGIKWYLHLMDLFSNNRLIIICSNQEYEYGFCTYQINIQDYKKR